MSLMAVIQSVWTVVVTILFIGIVLWAWSGSRSSEFDKAAHMPLEEDDTGAEPKPDSTPNI